VGVVSSHDGAAHLNSQHPTYGLDAFSTELVLASKAGRTVSVVIPARNEARTIAAVVTAIAEPHLAANGGSGLVDEIVVVDDASTDDTGAFAEAAGARVLTLNGSGGKGQAMAAGLEATSGDFVVYFDGDVENTHERYVPSLLGPLLLSQAVRLVKGYYERPLGGSVTGGGRVTELVARPLLDLLFPELSFLLQPLAGETAAARATFERIGFDTAYKVEMGLLLDVANAFGASSIAQVDLGTRVHRNRPIDELRPMAKDVMEAAMSRSR
jgi:glucosyl-3-phosphoglycerate synthase